MKYRRIALCLALSAGIVCAQTDNKPEIRGTVSEPGLNLGVSGAEITLFQFLEDSQRFVVRTPVATTFTDARGAFRFQLQHFGDYYLEAKKDTYIATMAGSGGPTESTGTPASVSSDHPVYEIRFSLLRPGEISGRVIDDDGNPVRGVGISTERTELGLYFGEGGRKVTDEDGAFAVKLGPGEYLLRTVPKGGDFEAVMHQFSEDDVKTVDQDIESSRPLAAPVPVSPAATSNIGAITVHQMPYYRAHVLVPGADCAPNQNWMFSAMPKVSPISSRYIGVPCGKELLVRNLKPGSYWFTLREGAVGSPNKWALSEVDITRENVEVSMVMTPPADLTGQFIPGEGVTLPKFQKVSLMLSGRLGNIFIASEPGSVDAEGKITVKSVPWIPHGVSVMGISANYYVKEIRYNGVPVADGMFTPVQGAPVQNLEIVLDDHAGTITGSVTDGDKPVSKPFVLVVKWPYVEGNLLSNPEHPAGDDQGRFQISGLAPGEYRVIALTRNTQISDQLLNRAEKVTLERGSLKDISLKLIDPSK